MHLIMTYMHASNAQLCFGQEHYAKYVPLP